MRAIKSRNTKPEVTVRSFLHRAGMRFRIHRSDLPGNPDLVLPKYRAAVFVHGCFWHQHQGCSRTNWPKSRLDYWKPKLESNVKRDRRNVLALQREGWTVHVIWECEVSDTRNLHLLVRRLKRGKPGE